MAYEMKGTIRYSETGSDKKLTIEALVNYFQDCSFEQSESLGYGQNYLVSRHVAWMVCTWQIQIKRMPVLKEKVLVKTWPYGFKSFFGYRDFSLETEDGELLAVANSVWIYVDTLTGKPTRVPEEELNAYGMEKEYPMEKMGRKLLISAGGKQMDAIQVPGYFIDGNQHVNNGKYVMVAQQYLPETVQVKEIRVEYRKAALLGDLMIPRVVEEEGQIGVSLEAEDGKPYCIVLFLTA